MILSPSSNELVPRYTGWVCVIIVMYVRLLKNLHPKVGCVTGPAQAGFRSQQNQLATRRGRQNKAGPWSNFPLVFAARIVYSTCFNSKAHHPRTIAAAADLIFFMVLMLIVIILFSLLGVMVFGSYSQGFSSTFR